jgi:hypothetical protein
VPLGFDDAELHDRLCSGGRNTCSGSHSREASRQRSPRGGSPRIVYPAHEVKFPLNVYRVLFQFDHGDATDVYRLRFSSPYLDMRVYTTADRWQADQTTWRLLAATNAGARVQMTVAGVDSSQPDAIYESAPIDVHFSRAEVEGAIYYWSTSSAGVMKGVLSQPAPTKFYSVDPDSTCVACHTVSRDGTRLAAGYGGETLQSVSIPDRAVQVPVSRDYRMGWSTFSPDGALLLIADRGALRLLDSDTGDPVGPADGVVPLGDVKVNHPDWSPLGDYVAVAVCEEAKNKDVRRCGIGRIPYDGGTWGPVELLVTQGGGDDNNFFPSYSPDGAWIAYVNATGKSKDQETSELRLIRADGSGAPIRLTRANQRVGPLDDVGGIGNTMPTWAPSSRPGTQWLAFSSLRDYGKVLAGAKTDQLWAVALDLELAAGGGDPSYAAFWLPPQDPGEHNHRAFWARDVDPIDCDDPTDDGCIILAPVPR